MCENGATAEWNIENWGLVNINPNDAKKIKCNIDFDNTVNLIEYLRNLNSNELVEDDFGNLRYRGAAPNNYVSFNNELWRIIGVMKDIENPDGSKESKVKLIRSESIGSYSWNNNGSTDWSDSALQKVLNEGAYYNRTSGDCPNGINDVTIMCDFSEIGLTEEAKSMISESVWNLGGTNSSSKTAKDFYVIERGISVYEGNSTKWTGKVGLMYPSDYGYATSGGTTCLNTILNNWDVSNVSYCKDEDWLLNKKAAQWTLTHNYAPNSVEKIKIFDVHFKGKITEYSMSTNLYTHPVIYLNPKVLVKNNSNGSNISPFILK